jgi:hypothetical protein
MQPFDVHWADVPELLAKSNIESVGSIHPDQRP